MFERKSEGLLPRGMFARRLARFCVAAMLLVLSALLIGLAGYHWLAGFSFIDALLNASMIMTGMGPVGELRTTGAKLFASAYALFSGLVFVTVIGMVVAPIMHRVLHKFHMDDTDDETPGDAE